MVVTMTTDLTGIVGLDSKKRPSMEWSLEVKLLPSTGLVVRFGETESP